MCFSKCLCLTFLDIEQFYLCGSPTFQLNVCLIPFRFSSVYNYWNIWVPSCSISSSVVDICSVFICSLFLYPKREKWTVKVLLLWIFTIWVFFNLFFWFGLVLSLLRLPECVAVDLHWKSGSIYKFILCLE